MSGWESREAEEEFMEVWDLIRKPVIASCMTVLKDKLKGKPFIDGLYLEASFEEINDWKITSIKNVVYGKGGEDVQNNRIMGVEGRFTILYYGQAVGQTLVSITSEGSAYNVHISHKRVEDLITAHIERKERTDSSPTGPKFSTRMEIYSKERERIMNHVMKDVRSALKNLGRSEEETNVMVLAAMEHDSFTPDMRLEDLLGLALRVPIT